MECDPYASSAERERGRGVFNHGFGAKFMSDLTGKPVRIVAQAFDYAGYQMTPTTSVNGSARPPLRRRGDYVLRDG